MPNVSLADAGRITAAAIRNQGGSPPDVPSMNAAFDRLSRGKGNSADVNTLSGLSLKKFQGFNCEAAEVNREHLWQEIEVRADQFWDMKYPGRAKPPQPPQKPDPHTCDTLFLTIVTQLIVWGETAPTPGE